MSLIPPFFAYSPDGASGRIYGLFIGSVGWPSSFADPVPEPSLSFRWLAAARDIGVMKLKSGNILWKKAGLPQFIFAAEEYGFPEGGAGIPEKAAQYSSRQNSSCDLMRFLVGWWSRGKTSGDALREIFFPGRQEMIPRCIQGVIQGKGSAARDPGFGLDSRLRGNDGYS